MEKKSPTTSVRIFTEDLPAFQEAAYQMRMTGAEYIRHLMACPRKRPMKVSKKKSRK